MRKSYKFISSTKIILATITLDLFAVLLGGADTLIPVYARDILRVGPAKYGWLQSATSAGVLAMALVLTHLPPFKRPGRTMLVAVAGFGLATLLFGVSRTMPVALLALFLIGALDMISVVVRSSLVQTLTPREMQGRVSAVNSVFITTSNQVGGFESGLLAQYTSPVFSVVFGGIGTLVTVLFTAIAWPSVRAYRADQAPD
jgi:MFS family permease